jgi:hypothetical protein
LIKRGEFIAALEHATAAHASFVALLGEGSLQAITALTLRSQALAGAGQTIEADAALAEARALADQHLHADHPQRLGIAAIWAGVLQKRGEHAECLRICEEIAAARERTLGPNHPSTFLAWNNLAAMHTELGQLAAAEATLRRVVAGRAALGIRDGFDVVGTGLNLAVTIRRQGRTAEAEELARTTRAIALRSLPETHWLIGGVTKEHGVCLRELGRQEDAEVALLDGYERLVRSVGEADARSQAAAGELVALYEAWHQPDEAARWRERGGASKQ